MIIFKIERQIHIQNLLNIIKTRRISIIFEDNNLSQQYNKIDL